MWCDFGRTAWRTYEMKREHDALLDVRCLLLVASVHFVREWELSPSTRRTAGDSRIFPAAPGRLARTSTLSEAPRAKVSRRLRPKAAYVMKNGPLERAFMLRANKGSRRHIRRMPSSITCINSVIGGSIQPRYLYEPEVPQGPLRYIVLVHSLTSPLHPSTTCRRTSQPRQKAPQLLNLRCPSTACMPNRCPRCRTTLVLIRRRTTRRHRRPAVLLRNWRLLLCHNHTATHMPGDHPIGVWVH